MVAWFDLRDETSWRAVLPPDPHPRLPREEMTSCLFLSRIEETVLHGGHFRIPPIAAYPTPAYNLSREGRHPRALRETAL